MSRSITLGQYMPGKTLMHRLDARAKLLSLILLILGLFTASSYWGLIFLLILALVHLSFTGVPLGYILRGVRHIFVLILLTLLLHFFFTTGGEVLIREQLFVAEITVESEGVQLGTTVALRLIILIFFTMLVTLTTTPLALTGAMESLLTPLKYLRLPVSEMSMVAMISLRFIPTLMEESDRIVKAQMARGARIGEGNFLQKARSLIPVIVPLFVSAFRRAEELAVAMEARCYRVGARRTSIRETRFAFKDYMVIIFSVALAAIMWFTPL